MRYATHIFLNVPGRNELIEVQPASTAITVTEVNGQARIEIDGQWYAIAGVSDLAYYPKTGGPARFFDLVAVGPAPN